MANELLSEALGLIQQVHGPLHQDAGSCESNLAMVRYSAQDLPMAIAHQTRAVVINERVLGLDHHDTAHAYGNLALFCQQAGKSREALGFMARALYLGNLVAGPLSPDHGSTYLIPRSFAYSFFLWFISDIPMLPQFCKTWRATDLLSSIWRKHWNLTKPCWERHTHWLLTRTTLTRFFLHSQNFRCHHIALAYNKLALYKDAMAYEKRNLAILTEAFGENDHRAKEANKWLNQFTSKAVQKQIEIKKQDAVVWVKISLLKDLLTFFAQPKILPKKRETPTAAQSTMGSMPLSDVLRYINTPSHSGKRGIVRLGVPVQPVAPVEIEVCSKFPFFFFFFFKLYMMKNLLP